MIRPLLRQTKNTILATLAGTGVPRVVANSEWRRQRLAILCYHGFAVADEGEWLPDYYFTAARLRERLALLGEEGYTVLPLGEAAARLASGTLPPRAVAITVDDGSADFYTVAAPVFEEFRVPVTLYLTTFHCLNQVPVFRFTTSYILWKGRRADANLPALGSGFNLLDTDVRNQAAARLQQYAREQGFSQEQRLAFLEKLSASLGVDLDRIRRLRLGQIITAEEGRDLVRRGFDLQIHTHRHRTPRDQALFVREVEENQRILIELGMTEAVHFCYPSGDYAPEFLPWLADCGVRTATTCEINLASPQSHPLLLPRLIDTMKLSNADFACRLAGIVRPQEQKQFRRTG